MKNTLTLLTLAIFSFGLIAFDAEAKRMGGGKNLGTQRQSINQQQAAPNKPQQAPAATPAADSPVTGLYCSGSSPFNGKQMGWRIGWSCSRWFTGSTLYGWRI